MSLPEGCLTYLEVLDEEYWSLQGLGPDADSAALRQAYRRTRGLDDEDPRKSEAENRYRLAVMKRLHEANRSALCFSGGGIRSATFGLGVLQALSSRSVRPDGSTALVTEFDYLSTVSGGGYLGSWFSAWAKRVGGAAAVVRELATPPATTFEPEPKPVQHLRRFSSYLSPRLGALSTDTWTLVATVLRNMFLNWLVLIPFLAAVLLIPLLCFQLARVPAGQVGEATLTFLLVTGFLAGAVGTGYVGFDLPSSGNARLGTNRYLVLCLGSLMLSAIHLNAFWAWWPAGPFPTAWLHLIRDGKNAVDLRHFMVFGAVMHGGGMLAGAMAAWAHYKHPPLRRGLEATLVAVITGAVGGAAGFLLTRVFPPDATTGWIVDAPLYTCAAFPLVMSVFLFAGTLLVGGTSEITEDEDREWWAHSGGWLLLPTLIWPIAAGCILYAAPWLDYLGHSLTTAASAVGLGGLTAWLGFLPKGSSGGPQSNSESGEVGPVDRLAALAAKLVLPAFLLLLAMAIAHLNTGVLRFIHTRLPHLPGPRLWQETAPVWMMMAGYLAISIGASWPINVNKFSLHAMYRLRLIRAYLGASNPSRNPHPFTGFDKNDNMPMCELSASKPLHIVNMTLNLVKGQNLAWQQRKAAPFTSTRLHTGSCRLGYRTSTEYGGKDPISLGTAVTVSGAAASPNMGYNSSPLLTIVMMLFNARLGWWLGNPHSEGNSWKKSGPTFGLRPFLDEMFGLTDDANPWVYLSDGGHFENLAIYEAVLRRCRVIVVSDAGCDPKYVYEDLGNAVRKINIDLGIPIVFADGGPCSSRHCTTARIHYSAVDGPGVEDGVLVYIKPSLNGDEPADVRQYAAANPAFPHESTADQFFEESQFESYRRLGVHIVESVCGDSEPLTLDQFVEKAKGEPASRSAAGA
ncbi:MAG TPA: hypothetical protein VER03_14575 [Bryobacteraceae bacterium]|nr:hypothetical protein [Bryobacteraceae bacterium]